VPTTRTEPTNPRSVIRGYTARIAERHSLPSAPKNLEKTRVVEHELYPVIDAGVDWLTVTCTDSVRRSKLEAMAVEELHRQSQTGLKVKPWRMLQFEGLSCGEVGYATTRDMSIFRLSSSAAWRDWWRFYELSTNCSRIDLQVTVAEVPNPEELIRTHRREALDHFAGWKRPPEVAIRDSNRRPPTLYVNQRVSAQMGRVYDKGSESKLDHYKACVRYEVEYKDAAAGLISSAIFRKPGRQDDAIARVAGFFRVRGISPRYSVESPSPLTCPRKRSDDRKRLEWLATQVRPAIESLFEKGRGADVVEALNLRGLPGLDQLVHLAHKPKKET
jgi:hypothetical protein